MWKRIKYHIWPRSVRFEEKLALLNDFTSKRALKPAAGKIVFDDTYTLRLDQFQDLRCDSMAELLAVMKRTPTFDSFTCNAFFENPVDKRYLRLGVSYAVVFSYIEVDVASNDIDLVESAHAFIKENFGLKNPEVSSYDVGRAKYLQPTIFIGRHFDAMSKEYFSSLSTFLSLLGFDIKEGEPYASESIPEKVQGRIDAQDIFIGIASGEKGHPWLVAEPSYARGKGKHIILLVEEETQYDPTILGRDFEQIRFPHGCIEKTFIPLLQEFRSVRVRGL